MSLVDPTLPTLARNVDERLTTLEAGGGGGASWGGITGTLADQTDLQTVLDGKQASGSYASSAHDHDADYAALGHAHSYNDLTDKPTLFDGAYSSLSGTPTLGNSASKNVGTAAG